MENFEILPTEENLIKTLEADLLGRNQQLSYFYNLLLAQKGASTIAVDGKWGSGKTFFIKQSTMVINAKNPVSIIEKEKREKILSKLFLTESDNYDDCNLAIYYDAWENDNDTEPVLSLIYEITKQLSVDFSLSDISVVKTAGAIIEAISGHNINGIKDALTSEDPFKKFKEEKDVEQKIKDFFASILVAFLLFKISEFALRKVKNDYIKVVVVFIISLMMRYAEKTTHTQYLNSLLAVMIYGFFIRNYMKESAQFILDKMNNIWKYGKLYLFSFVGMAINPTLVGEYIYVGLFMLTISLSFRSVGVLLALTGTNLNLKERIFCVIAYLPKATVQSAKSSIPLQMGVAGGEIMQAIAILSVLVTAPLGAIGIKLTSDKLLNRKEEKNSIMFIRHIEKSMKDII